LSLVESRHVSHIAAVLTHGIDDLLRAITGTHGDEDLAGLEVGPFDGSMFICAESG
jgi:hypothetical protein